MRIKRNKKLPKLDQLDPYLKSQDLTAIIGGSQSFWSRLRTLNFGPKYSRHGKVCMYKKADVAKWLKSPMGQRYFSGASFG